MPRVLGPTDFIVQWLECVLARFDLNCQVCNTLVCASRVKTPDPYGS